MNDTFFNKKNHKRSRNLFAQPINISQKDKTIFRCTMKPKDHIEKQPNNPLHGIKLADILQYLTQRYSWEDLAGQVNINCFKNDPSIKSSLKFLRKTPWAREKIEYLYLQSIKK